LFRQQNNLLPILSSLLSVTSTNIHFNFYCTSPIEFQNSFKKPISVRRRAAATGSDQDCARQEKIEDRDWPWNGYGATPMLVVESKL
jgi:hypothetical protein